MRKLALMTLGLALFSYETHAQIFKLRVSDYGIPDSNPAYGAFKTAIDTEIAKVEAEVNKDLPSAPPKRLMEGMANSSVMAGKGVGSDYASNMQVFLLGAGVGVGADLEKDKTTKSDLSGVGVAPGAIIGMNLGWMDSARFLGMDTNRLNVYLNFMNYGYDHKFNDKKDEESSAELDMTSLGVHFRYDWIKGNNSKLLGWGGVKFHFGYEYNKTDIRFNSKINEAVKASTANGESIDDTIQANPSVSINSKTHSIPLELSTDVQFLYILSLYTGLGADMNFGEAKGSGGLNAPAANLTCTGGACGAGQTVAVQPEGNVDAKGSVNPFTFRGFAGVQVNLPYLRVFVQANKELGSDLVGATTGVRFVY